ncbi:MAG: FAD-dependent oxidoreductase [Anaerolineae bacterium]|nr:FAD-dependent oxidoreductase [Candidatus Roseilinea sp.]MDW8451173.1 FAD-dependent oxidoreductase [Anaerolineae bacterium]
MQTKVRLIIVGAGIVGCSAAYHLAKLGWRDILVLDKGELFEVDGSTSHAPGGMFLTNPSKMMVEFAKYSRQWYGELHAASPEPLLYGVGGLEVAYTKARLSELYRRWGWAKAYGLEGAEVISPQEATRLNPLINPKVIHGAYFTPFDAVAKGVRLITAMARAAEAFGSVTFQGNTPVTDLIVEHGRIKGLMTDRGAIEAETVLWCTNIWGDVLTRKYGVRLPLMAAQHLYTVTEPIPELKGETVEVRHPLMRHQDHSMYFRQQFDCYGVGSYRHEPLMVAPDDVGKSAKRDFTPEHFVKGWESTVELLPALKGAQLTVKFNGMFAFTTDGYPIMGETAVKGLWACVGLWLTHAGGAGNAIAQWMTFGDPGLDLREADITRFQKHYFTKRYIHARCAQNYREVYDIIHPMEQIGDPRNVRLSPFHHRLVEHKAQFFQSAGWEVAQWFEENARLLEKYEDRIPQRNGWAARFWSPIQGAEHLAVRDGAGMFNLTPLAVIEVKGPGALAFLNRLCANQIDRPVGRVIYTSLLNERGGIVADLTVVRMSTDRFWVITGGGVLPHDLAWIERHAPDDGSVAITDVSSAWGKIGLWGPKAREVLARVAEEDVSNAAFPYYTMKSLMIDAAPAVALRVSYAGELGWEIYALAEYALRVWDALWEAGQDHGLVLAGNGAFDSLRLEKGYRLWGSDIHTDYNPFEAGLGWAVKLDKPDFIGREALIRAKESGLRRRLCCLTLDNAGVLMGKEPIFAPGEDGKAIGYVTSANYGYSVGKFIAYGYLPVAHANVGAKVEIEYFGERLPATVSAEPLFDPAGTRMKC